MNARLFFYPSVRTPAAILRRHGGAKFVAAIIAQAVGSLIASLLLK